MPESNRNGRGDWIRTNDPLLPKQVRYQTALRPEPVHVAGRWRERNQRSQADKARVRLNQSNRKSKCELANQWLLAFFRGLRHRRRRRWLSAFGCYGRRR